MTATVPDLGQFLEVREAARLARSDEPDIAAYYTGIIVGFTASFAVDDTFTDALTDARRHMWAATYDLPNAIARWELLGKHAEDSRKGVYLRACGVLFGFREGTADRPDAETCSMCEARILTLTDDEAVHCARHGWLCNEDTCRRSTCDRSCFGAE